MSAEAMISASEQTTSSRLLPKWVRYVVANRLVLVGSIVFTLAVACATADAINQMASAASHLDPARLIGSGIAALGGLASCVAGQIARARFGTT